MLKLVLDNEKKQDQVINTDFTQAEFDHNYLLKNYFESYKIRNFSEKTIKRESAFLISWFSEHGKDGRPLYTWESMEAIKGRKRILDYANALIDSGIKSETIRAYVGILSRYFSYVLEHPYILRSNGETKRIFDLYGRIEQPVSEYDIPRHVYDGEKLGIPIDPSMLYEFYSLLKNSYIKSPNYMIKARNYSIAVLAGETGLRSDELLHLETIDLFFESKKVQTRHAKATRGSGKRARQTLFTPLAQDTMRFYLTKIRPEFENANNSNYLFLSKTGNILNYNAIQIALKEMIDIAIENNFPILKHMSWHWFRRIFATRFIERFPNQLSVLVTLLGHVTPNTVHCYIKHSDAWVDEKIKAMLEGGF